MEQKKSPSMEVAYAWESAGDRQDWMSTRIKRLGIFFNYLLMYNALTIMGPLPDVKMNPDLAKSWEISKDGREYTFLLQQGVKFHHGKEFDSGDVKYSIERVMNPATRSPRAFAYRWIDSVIPSISTMSGETERILAPF